METTTKKQDQPETRMTYRESNPNTVDPHDGQLPSTNLLTVSMFAPIQGVGSSFWSN